jgi:hypothetical protein
MNADANLRRLDELAPPPRPSPLRGRIIGGHQENHEHRVQG